MFIGFSILWHLKKSIFALYFLWGFFVSSLFRISCDSPIFELGLLLKELKNEIYKRTTTLVYFNLNFKLYVLYLRMVIYIKPCEEII